MENLNDVYKTGALLNTKRNSVAVQLVQEERKKIIEKQVKTMYRISEQDEEILQQLINKESIKVEIEDPVIDVTDTSKVKTLNEFINEARGKDREAVIEIGESLQDLINSASEDVKTFKEDHVETIEEFANNSIERDEGVEETQIEEDKTVEDSDKSNLIKPKYFVIEIGDEKNPKQLVVDIDGRDVGTIEDGKFEINEDYFNSKIEKININEYISSKVHTIEEQQKIREEIKPKTLEQLADMDLDSGKDIVEKADKAIEEHEKGEIEPKTQEKGIKDEVDNDLLLEDEEDRKDDTISELDEISKEKDGNKMQDFLESNSSKKLTILLPYTLTDQLNNHQLKEKGEPITVYQLKGTVKPIFVLQQGNRILYGDRYNEQIQKNMSRVPYTTGVVREVSDEDTTATVTLLDGTEKEFLAKGAPHDISQSEKDAVVAKLSELSAELKRISEITQDDFIDFKIEFPGGIEQKCQRIDAIEMEMYKTCEEYGIVPPVEVKTYATEETKEEDLEEKEDDDNEERTRYGDALGTLYKSKFDNQ